MCTVFSRFAYIPGEDASSTGERKAHPPKDPFPKHSRETGLSQNSFPSLCRSRSVPTNDSRDSTLCRRRNAVGFSKFGNGTATHRQWSGEPRVWPEGPSQGDLLEESRRIIAGGAHRTSRNSIQLPGPIGERLPHLETQEARQGRRTPTAVPAGGDRLPVEPVIGLRRQVDWGNSPVRLLTRAAQ